jgi:hypothetical protein
MYPSGHPSLKPAATSVGDRMQELLQTRPSLSIGVARSQLVIEGVATDPANPVLSDLAHRLHNHHLGAITFNRGVTDFEIEQFLQLVAVDAQRDGQPLGLGPSSKRQAQPHINLYPVAYDRLQLTEEEEFAKGDTPLEERKAREARTRAAQLWVGLAQAAMATEDADFDAEPAVVAKAISDHQRSRAYDQVIVGYLLQIADELKSAGGQDAVALKNRMTKLVSHLDAQTLQLLLSMGGDAGQRHRFLLDASQGMSVDAVIKLAHAASQTEQQTISDSLLRILEKLAQHAETGSGMRRKNAEQSVRDQISELIRDWSLLDPNPDEYTEALQRMARSGPMFRVAPERIHKPEAERIVQMALEINVTGPAVSRAVGQLVSGHQVKWLVDTVNTSGQQEAAAAIWRDLATKNRLAEILKAEPLDVEALDGLLPKLGADAAEPMLEALMESESRQTRRVLLDRLRDMGHAVAPLAVARLADSRWYVQRNMLAIIAELPRLPEGFRPGDFFEHPDDRVRREALRLMLRQPTWRERAICRALADPDDRTVRLALSAAMDDCPKSALPLVVSKATSGVNEDQRVTALRVLGATKTKQALDVLLQIAAPRKKMLRTKLPPKTPEFLAALRELQRFREDPRVRPVLAAAAASRDHDIVAAAMRRRSSVATGHD